MRISDWSSDVCSADLIPRGRRAGWRRVAAGGRAEMGNHLAQPDRSAMDRSAEAVALRDLHVLWRAAIHDRGQQRERFKLGHWPAAESRWVSSEERRVGKEGVSTCRSRWSPE